MTTSSSHMEVAQYPSGRNTPVAEFWCDTDVNMEKLTFLWKIRSFMKCFKKMGNGLQTSFSSSSESKSKMEWGLKIFPYGLDKECVGYMSLYVFLVTSSKSEIYAKLTCSVLNPKGKKIKVSDSRKMWKFTLQKHWGFPKFISHEVLFQEPNRLLFDNKLTILCEISICVESVKGIQVPESDMSEDYKNFFENRKFCDVTILVNGRKLKAHKTILAARSKVFCAMFEHNMQEKMKNHIEITDMDHEVMEELLLYIYTGKVDNMDDKAERLLVAADKYALERLTVICEDHLSRNLAISNVVRILMLSDKHSLGQLKMHAINFIYNNATEVTATREWLSITSTHPHLINEFPSLALQQIPSIESPEQNEMDLTE